MCDVKCSTTLTPPMTHIKGGSNMWYLYKYLWFESNLTTPLKRVNQMRPLSPVIRIKGSLWHSLTTHLMLRKGVFSCSDFHRNTMHYLLCPNFHPNTIHNGFRPNCFSNTIHYKLCSNCFNPNIIHYGFWPNLRPNTLPDGFWPNFHPNTLHYGFWSNFFNSNSIHWIFP